MITGLQKQFTKMVATKKLFRLSITGQEIWDIYISSFGSSPIYRDPKSSVYNCNYCKNFIRRYGNIVSVGDDNTIISLFDFENTNSEYEQFLTNVREVISKSTISEVFVESFESLSKLGYGKCKKADDTFKLGVAVNYKQYNKEEANKFGVVSEGEVRTFTHYNLEIPKEFVDQSGKSIESITGSFRDAKNVFKRAMEEISLDTLYLVRDLINQGSLLDGATHLYKVEQFIPLKKEYDELPANLRDSWCWKNSYNLPYAKFKNELIGVLCSELSEGQEINKACQSWNKRVDPVNYMKTTAPITKKQIEEAKRFVEENGYEESFNRRFATIDDIKVSEILHSNVGKGDIPKVSIFDGVKATSTRHKRAEFEGVEEVGIGKFMQDILPTCTSVEAYLENNQEGNMVSLTTANNPDSKPIFKWSNNYSWTFNGNLAGKSQIKEAVKVAGGEIEGVLRASMIWNETGADQSDLDLWCEQPNGEKIGFSTNFRKDRGYGGGSFSSCSGQLDLDNTNPGNKIGVENIYFIDSNKMKDGVYLFWVNQYSDRGSKGFKFEIEFNGETYNYEYTKSVIGSIRVAEVTLKNGVFSIEHLLPESNSSKEIYGLETKKFHKINLVCLSPNHWGSNVAGNGHYFFMLDNCKAPEPIRSFHNENLLPELAEHRKVLEVLGSTNMIASTNKQLSGLGFNATARGELILRLQGTHRRVIRVKF